MTHAPTAITNNSALLLRGVERRGPSVLEDDTASDLYGMARWGRQSEEEEGQGG